MKVVEGKWKAKNGRTVDIKRNAMGELITSVQEGSYLYYSEEGECVKEKTRIGRIYLKIYLNPVLKSTTEVDGVIQTGSSTFFEPWDLEELIEEKVDEKEVIKRSSNPILSLDLCTE